MCGRPHQTYRGRSAPRVTDDPIFMLESAAVLARRNLLLGPAGQRSNDASRDPNPFFSNADEIGSLYPDSILLRQQDHVFYKEAKGGLFSEFCDVSGDELDADARAFIE